MDGPSVALSAEAITAAADSAAAVNDVTPGPMNADGEVIGDDKKPESDNADDKDEEEEEEEPAYEMRIVPDDPESCEYCSLLILFHIFLELHH